MKANRLTVYRVLRSGVLQQHAPVLTLAKLGGELLTGDEASERISKLTGLSHIEWDLIEDSGWNGHTADGHIGQAISAGDFYVGADKLYDHTPRHVVSHFDNLEGYEI